MGTLSKASGNTWQKAQQVENFCSLPEDQLSEWKHLAEGPAGREVISLPEESTEDFAGGNIKLQGTQEWRRQPLRDQQRGGCKTYQRTTTRSEALTSHNVILTLAI